MILDIFTIAIGDSPDFWTVNSRIHVKMCWEMLPIYLPKRTDSIYISLYTHKHQLNMCQIVIFNQPRFPWNNNKIPLLNHHLGWGCVRSLKFDQYIWDFK